MAESLRDPVLYPHWVWLLGAGLMLVAVAWGVGLLIAYRRSQVSPKATLQSLNEVRRSRYQRLITEVETDFLRGDIDVRAAHLSVAAIIRAAASERMNQNVESTSVGQARASYNRWPAFAEALAWAEQPSFGLEREDAGASDQSEAIRVGLQYARQVVGQ